MIDRTDGTLPYRFFDNMIDILFKLYTGIP